MASTNKTTNYDLSQYVGSDKPTYLGDYNSDMQKIDAQMKVNENNANIAKTDADLALANAETAQETANTANGTAETANSTANSALELGAENQAQIVELTGKFDNLYKVLWKNSNPSNQFNPQNITLLSNDYDAISIIYRQFNGDDHISSTGILPKGTNYEVYGLAPSSSVPMRSRKIESINDTELRVLEGYTGGTNNAVCIPVMIIGYKTGLTF